MKKFSFKKETVIAIIAAVLIIVIAIFLYIILTQKGKFETNEKMYQYFADQKYEYTGKTEFSKVNDEIHLKNQQYDFVLDSKPVYFENQNKILLPTSMACVLPNTYVVKRINYLSEISRVSSSDFSVKKDKLSKTISDCFLFDGKNLYIFLTKAKITYNDKVINLEPFSYIIVNYNQSIQIFDYTAQKSSSEKTGQCTVMAEMESGYKVNLSTDTLYRFDGQEQLLFSQPELLDELK